MAYENYSTVVMPMGVVGVALIPLGYDALAWQAMGWGIDIMLAIARWVAALPGAEGRVPAFGSGALLAATAGFLILAIPVSRLRLAGVPFFALALLLAVNAPRPDVLIDQNAGTIAVRTGDGRLSILNAKRGRIAAENWLAADGDTRQSGDALDGGFRCDRDGCVARLPDGALIAAAQRPAAFADDCRAAAIVVSRFDIPEPCSAPGIDRTMLATTGALSLRHVDGRWLVETVRAPSAERPWYGRAKPADPAVLARFERRLEAAQSGAQAPLAEPSDIPVPEAPEQDGEGGGEE